MSQERRLQVLRAIVEDYVVTEEPVGSKQLVERHQMDVSPATIRNDMAALEDEGYIVAPHTSAGRIPTDKGYRLFVDSLAEVKPLTPAERRAIQSFLDQAVDLDDVMSRTVRLLAQLTHQVALAQYPRLAISSVRHVELVDLGQRRVLLVVIADTGRVEQRVIAVPEDVSEADLQAMRSALNAAVAGKKFSQVAREVQPLTQMFTGSARAALSAVLANLLEAVVAPTEDRVVLAGTANLARSRKDFEATLEPVLEALEEQMVLLRLLGQSDDVEAAHVRIGSENDVERLARTSVITSGYGSASEVVATIGVLGPTRMDYSTSISAVQAVARYVGRLIGE